MRFNKDSKSVLMTIIPVCFLGFAACSPSNSLNHSPSTIAAATPEGNADGIRQGTIVQDSDPFRETTVAIINGEGQICTGSLIAPKLILTAAHCIALRVSEDQSQISAHPEDHLVVFGKNIQASDVSETVRTVEKLSIHPDYFKQRKTIGYRLFGRIIESGVDHADIALLQIFGDVPPSHRPAQILKSSKTLKNRATVDLAGYGTQGDTNESTGELLKTKVKILDSKFSQSEILLDQSGGTGACQGDSGGPAFLKIGRTHYLWGVTSRSLGPITPADRGCPKLAIYTNLLNYSQWIAETKLNFANQTAAL